MSNTQIPRFLMANDSSEGATEIWIIRTRPDLFMARIECVGLDGLRLHLWPPGAARKKPEKSLRNLAESMTQIYANCVDSKPSQIECKISNQTVPPQWLMVNAVDREWYGVLHTGKPRFIAAVLEQGPEIIRWYDPMPEQLETLLLANETVGFYLNSVEDLKDEG